MSEVKVERAPEHDKRIERGDDYAADAWCVVGDDRLHFTAVGYTLHLTAEELKLTRCHIEPDQAWPR